MKPGLYKGMSYADYARIDAVRSGDLNRMKRTPLHARHAMSHEHDSPSMILGRATHVAVLEPDSFSARYAVEPTDVNRRTKAGKAEIAAFQAECQRMGREVLTAQEWNLSLAMRDAVHQREVAGELLKGKGINEGVMVWEDEETGLLCKARFDRLIQHYRDPWTDEECPAFIDLKTSRDCSAGGYGTFGADLEKFGYHISAAHYIAGGLALTGIARRWVWLVVENEPPHDVAVYDFHDTGLELAETIRRRRLATLRQCKETGIWPGSPDAVQSINLPAWVFKVEGGE